MEYFGIIYKCTNKVNSKIYIGMTTRTLEERIKFHFYRAKKENYYFGNALLKYGSENFIWESIHQCTTKEEMIEMEKFYISQFRSYIGFENCSGYNMTLGGEFGNILTNHPNRINIIEKIKIGVKKSHQRPDVKAKMLICNRNSSKLRRMRSLVKKSKTGFVGEEKLFVVYCHICNESIEVLEHEGLHPRKEKYFCSKKCKSVYSQSFVTKETMNKFINSPRTGMIGKHHSEESKLKMSSQRAGAKNVKAKLYTLIDPNGTIIVLHGEYTKYILEHHLSKTILENHIGEVITLDMIYKGRKRSLKNIGWCLLSVE